MGSSSTFSEGISHDSIPRILKSLALDLHPILEIGVT